ncbi:MAG: zeta toxin family protein [Rikenellaceae bacterium]|nr:zeta toxin family protein [Rikenellaceae bacterium]
MNVKYSRPLHSPELVGEFLENVLCIEDPDTTLCARVSDGEKNLPDTTDRITLYYTNHRAKKYRSDEKRWELREKIIDELYGLPRLDNDDEITLGNGGAKPLEEAKFNKQVYFIIGLPASGKSSIATKIADFTGSLILDSDYAKRKFPEYLSHPYGASLVHHESSFLIYGDESVRNIPKNFECLQIRCLKSGINLCIPTIGANHESLIKNAMVFKKIGYTPHLIMVQLDRRKATQRALERFDKTGRYVPLGLIFDVYSHEPLISYYRIKEKNLKNRIFRSIAKLSTDVAWGCPPKVVSYKGDSPVIEVYK